ncbi:B12-binding domain-containing radical SAM protein [Actinacidiphila glaucinigra]|uniref:B12-binding domain-containing radical SAM protein n=1 Tax=Actinacidiphila glaucinigra TaxID=235986 RepID=UPI002DDA7933|nr:radical SAM protein [Actinacidiphila glaucinigra]WSD65070.1 radical SAM protein [Actinacidiphila glaucinigra]
MSLTERAARLLDRLSVPKAKAEAIARDLNFTDPNRMHDSISDAASVDPERVIVTGSLDRRLVLVDAGGSDQWVAADLSGRSHASRRWPTWTEGRIRIHEPDTWLSSADLMTDALTRLIRPRVLLVSLYHPEHFPLPRFPLAVSDLARAARATLTGQIRLMDMQLGVTLEDILKELSRGGTDILGVSATFGQHDIMLRLLEETFEGTETGEAPPLILAGGSLTVRNEHTLLERFPRLLIGRAAGEPTIQDVLAYWHGDLNLQQIRGIGFHGGARGDGALAITPFRRTGAVANRLQTDYFPELDLLEETFVRRGVAQLEGSRGCTNFCSFCPRGHKGTWAGAVPETFPWILQEMRQVFDRHPSTSRTIYFVDEEFVGRGDDAVPRALAMAEEIHDAGFSWETSCRIDQVVSRTEGRDWHVERATMWRALVERGLRRCLFGIESGVTSVLERFNKETTAEQNALGIRTLTALGVPPRFTYITFDQLMTLEELEETYRFQGRTDLLLHPVSHLSAEEIVDGVRDDGFISNNTIGRPFYQAISYMMVSMECLIGASYTKQAQAAGLLGEVRPSMGRVDARFRDWRIGRCSLHAQMWIDRNFALDYTLKSLEKVLDGTPRHLLRGARIVIKDAAYQLLGDMLSIARTYDLTAPAEPEFDAELTAAMDLALARLAEALQVTLYDVAAGIPGDLRTVLHGEYEEWRRKSGWTLINAADFCE